MRQIPKKEKIVKEKKEDKMLNESEVFKTETKHDLEVVPVPVETSQQPVEKVTETPKKQKKVFPKEMCGCGKEVSLNMKHLHVKQKHHMSWLESQKEKPEEPKKDVEVEKISVSVPEESETKKQEISKPKQINQPFEIDYQKIIDGVSQNYINYKLQKQEHKKKQAPVDNYKQKYEELLLKQEKDKKKHQADMYLYKQNQVFGRTRRKNGWFN